MTIRWIYLDESEFELNNRQYIAYGALITEDIVSQENIDRAMSTLKSFRAKKDKDYIPKNDDRTIERGYFHACDDACCAHTSICREIENLNGEFSLNCVPKSEKYNINYLSITSAIKGFHHSGYSAFIYEQRTGLTNEIINNLIRDYELSVIQDYANSLFMPLRFSEPGYKITDKKEPGIQFIDFILWTYQRKLKGDAAWFERVTKNSMKSSGIHMTTQYAEDQNNEDYFLCSTLNKGLSLPEVTRIYEDKNLNSDYLRKDNVIDINDKNILDSLLLINDIMINVRYNPNPSRFFESQIKDGIENRKNNLEIFLITFLKLFDTCNFLNLTSDVNMKNRMLLARKIVALSFCQDFEQRIVLQNKLIQAWELLKIMRFV